jgi:hypothetical protein
MKAKQDFTLRYTGSAVMAETINLAALLAATDPEGVEIVSIMLHLSAAGGTSENFTAQILYNGTVLDYVLVSEDTELVSDIGWTPPKAWPLLKTDKIQLKYANTNSRDWTLRIVYRQFDGQEMNT